MRTSQNDQTGLDAVAVSSGFGKTIAGYILSIAVTAVATCAIVYWGVVPTIQRHQVDALAALERSYSARLARQEADRVAEMNGTTREFQALLQHEEEEVRRLASELNHPTLEIPTPVAKPDGPVVAKEASQKPLPLTSSSGDGEGALAQLNMPLPELKSTDSADTPTDPSSITLLSPTETRVLDNPPVLAALAEPDVTDLKVVLTDSRGHRLSTRAIAANRWKVQLPLQTEQTYAWWVVGQRSGQKVVSSIGHFRVLEAHLAAAIRREGKLYASDHGKLFSLYMRVGLLNDAAHEFAQLPNAEMLLAHIQSKNATSDPVAPAEK